MLKNNIVSDLRVGYFFINLLYYKFKKSGRHLATSGKGENCMLELLQKELETVLPKISEQEGNEDPTVYSVYQFPMSGWKWFATEGEAIDDDFLFFGYVVGLEREWGFFYLSELGSVDIDGIKVCSDKDHVPKPLSECLKQYGLAEN